MTSRYSRHSTHVGLVLTFALAIVLAGCAPSQAPVAAKAPAEVAIEGAALTLKGADQLMAGWTRFTVTNDGQGPRVATLVRLKDGTTLPAFEAAVKQGFEQAMQLATPLSGPMAGPGKSVAVLVDLQPGQYALVGGPGTLRPFTVQTAASGPAASAPKSDSTITLRDFSFDIPDSLPSGRRTFSVPNAGQQPHELMIGRLLPGKTGADLLAYASQPPSGPPPLEPVAGVSGIPAAGSALFSADLEPGQYYAVCFIPDPASRKPHVALGMIKEFTVK